LTGFFVLGSGALERFEGRPGSSECARADEHDRQVGPGLHAASEAGADGAERERELWGQHLEPRGQASPKRF